VRAAATDGDVVLELVTSAGRVVGRDRRAARRHTLAAGERLPLRPRTARRHAGRYTSPVWLEGARGTPRGEWLAGDGHVHTCYSHDAYCPTEDDNTGPTTAYSSLGSVTQRFAEAAVKDLDFLVISDHNDVRAWSDPAFGSRGVLGVHAYERSLKGGHAHALGVTGVSDLGDAGAFADSVNADGGLFQINHATEKLDGPLTGCEEAARGGRSMHWKYGFSVRPDTLEVWNATTLLQPAELYWECWLQRGVRVPATGGSDSHGGNQLNLGQPTTWVLARDASERAILEGLRAGRTTITRLPPAYGAARLLLEADGDRNGSFESTMGDTIAPGAPMRVRADGLSAPATVRVRANGATIRQATLQPGESVTLDAPAAAGWVRASLLGPQDGADVNPLCRPGNPFDGNVPLCTADLATSR
jgi:hypothetical protein